MYGYVEKYITEPDIDTAYFNRMEWKIDSNIEHTTYHVPLTDWEMNKKHFTKKLVLLLYPSISYSMCMCIVYTCTVYINQICNQMPSNYFQNSYH